MNGRGLNASTNLGMRQVSAFTTLNIVLEALGSTIGQVKKIKGTQIGREERTLCFLCRWHDGLHGKC